MAFLQPKSEGFVFQKWPNHITIVPHFYATDYAILRHKIAQQVAALSPITYAVGSEAYFGVNQNVKVSTLVVNDKLAELHFLLTQIVLEIDPQMDTKLCYENYRPHITHNEPPFPAEQDIGVIDALYIVEEVLAETGEKRVAAVLQL